MQVVTPTEEGLLHGGRSLEGPQWEGGVDWPFADPGMGANASRALAELSGFSRDGSELKPEQAALSFFLSFQRGAMGI